jgi:GT2 family glycosyltransferase
MEILIMFNTVIIPTRNRPVELVKAVNSIRNQSRVPDELIIIDQSQEWDSKLHIETLLKSDKRLKVTYVHDMHISGLVQAKDIAVKLAKGKIIYFIDDDVILESDYIEQIERGFAEKQDMVGCCGILSNIQRKSCVYRFVFHLFHRGIFKDERIDTHGKFHGRGHRLIASEMLSGGVSAWRREVFSVVPFDLCSHFHMLEDIDFSSRVAREFGPRLYINPNARVEHHFLKTNNDESAEKQRRKLIEYINYYKKRNDWPRIKLNWSWLIFGLMLESVFLSLMLRSLEPLEGYFDGIREGFAK